MRCLNPLGKRSTDHRDQYSAPGSKYPNHSSSAKPWKRLEIQTADRKRANTRCTLNPNPCLCSSHKPQTNCTPNPKDTTKIVQSLTTHAMKTYALNPEKNKNLNSKLSTRPGLIFFRPLLRNGAAESEDAAGPRFLTRSSVYPWF